MIGGFGYRWLSAKVNVSKVLTFLLVLYALCMIALFGISVFMTPTMTLLLIPFCLTAFANGATYPIVVADALKPFAENSGKASALLNTLQLGICFFASAAVSLFSANALLATTSVMVLTIGFMGIGYYLRIQK